MQSGLRGSSEGRDAGIDVARGLLVLFVILGHFSELTQRQNLMTWFGMGFRMPLFIGLSGYLFNLERARSTAVPALVRKYYRRLILPWLVACAVHLTIVGAIDWITPLYLIIRPPFHLWFVPIILFFIVTTRACGLSRATMLGIAIPASIGAMYVFGVGHEIEQFGIWMPDRRYFIYPIYFTFGLWIAERGAGPRKMHVALLLIAIGLLWWCRLYDHPSIAGEVAAELILSLPLIALLPSIRGRALRLPLIAGIGRNSLFFYLWHPLALGLWASLGVAGAPMLALALLTMMAGCAVIAHLPKLRDVLGVLPPDRIAGEATATEPPFSERIA